MATRYNYTGGIVTDGLVLHLDAAKRDSYPGSGTTWYDLSGNGYNASLINDPTHTGVSKTSAFDYDATNDGTRIFNLPNFTQEVSLEAWIRVEGDHGGNNTGGTIYNQGAMYFQYVNDGRLRSYFREGYYYTTATITYNQWHHVVQVWDRVNYELKVYIDSTLVQTTILADNTGNAASTTGDIGMQGTDPNGAYSRMFNGKIPVVRLYQKVLSADEISQNFNALRGRYGI